MWGMSTNILLYRINIHVICTAVHCCRREKDKYRLVLRRLSDTSWVWSTSNHWTSRTAQTSEKTCAVYVNVTCEWSGRLYILKRLGTSLLSCKPMLSLHRIQENLDRFDKGPLHWISCGGCEYCACNHPEMVCFNILSSNKLNTFHLL